MFPDIEYRQKRLEDLAHQGIINLELSAINEKLLDSARVSKINHEKLKDMPTNKYQDYDYESNLSKTILFKELMSLYKFLFKNVKNSISNQSISINLMKIPISVICYYKDFKITLRLVDFLTDDPSLCMTVTDLQKDIQRINLDEKITFTNL